MMSVHHALTGMRLSVTTKFAFVVTIWVRSFRLCLVLTFIELDVFFIPVFDPVLCEILIFECLHDGNVSSSQGHVGSSDLDPFSRSEEFEMR